MKPRRTLVSILVPAFNEELNVERTYRAIRDVFERLPGYDYEIIFTDNHSTDRTFALLEEIARADTKVRVIRFSRNYGYERSLLAGYKAAMGDCSVQIDCDLQDPPELIPEMLALWREGHQVVYGIRRSLEESALVASTRRVFYRLVNALSEDDLPLNAGEFRLVDRRIIDELKHVNDPAPYIRGLISAMGFSQVGILYDRRARVAGESKFPFRKMLALATDGVLNHSLIPLRIASAVGLIVGIFTFLLIFVYLAGRVIFGQSWPAGFATITLLQLMAITLNAVFLGIIGEYLGRIFFQAKRQRPPIVEKSFNLEMSRSSPALIEREAPPAEPLAAPERRTG